MGFLDNILSRKVVNTSKEKKENAKGLEVWNAYVNSYLEKAKLMKQFKDAKDISIIDTIEKMIPQELLDIDAEEILESAFPSTL